MEQIKALSDAVKILEAARNATVNDGMPIFMKVVHAQQHVEREMAAFLAEQSN